MKQAMLRLVHGSLPEVLLGDLSHPYLFDKDGKLIEFKILIAIRYLYFFYLIHSL